MNTCNFFLQLHINVYNTVDITLMCLSIGTPKNNKCSICPKWNIHYFQVSQNLGRVQPHHMCLNIGTPKTINFPFETNGKLMILGVPILKQFRVNPHQILAVLQFHVSQTVIDKK